jgi:hypothetical protein
MDRDLARIDWMRRRRSTRKGRKSDLREAICAFRASTDLSHLRVDEGHRGIENHSMLEEVTDRESLGESYRQSSLATRKSLAKELPELDHLAGEGLEL